MTLGLKAIDTPSLETLLRSLHRKFITAPLTPAGLASIGLQDQSNILLAHMRNLDDQGVHAVLVAVLAERRQ